MINRIFHKKDSKNIVLNLKNYTGDRDGQECWKAAPWNYQGIQKKQQKSHLNHML